jgi:hypothetical protein
MNKMRSLHIISFYHHKRVALLILLFALPCFALAQETDTTRQKIDVEERPQQILNLKQQADRSMTGGVMTNMGTYQIPTEGQYYHRPFKGQFYLDKAVEAYRKEIENRIGENWYWQFLRAVSPYVRLELGAFQMEQQLQMVERDNPLFQSFQNDEKKQ